MSENQPYRICFILGMMPRTGTNWVHDLLKTSEFTCDVGPIWEDNILNQTAGIKQLAKSIVGSWNPKWKAGSIKLDVSKAQLKLEERIEQAIEAFIFAIFDFTRLFLFIFHGKIPRHPFRMGGF